jgi:cytochrome d ubiquinol oxidase subunit II
VRLRLTESPWGYAFPAVAVLGWAAVRLALARGRDREAFVASSAYLLGMVASAAFGIYPFVLPSNGDPTVGLTAREAAASPHALAVGLAWWIPGILFAALGQVLVYRVFRGKVRPESAP